MKFIHCADLHLASALDSRFTSDKARLRRSELFDSFSRLADKAVCEGVSALLVAGDIFDEKNVSLAAKKRFLKIVSAHPEVDFLCISGNHDRSFSEESEDSLPENLKTFGTGWKFYSYGAVDVYGIESTDENCYGLYTALSPDPERLNIVMMHGQTVPSKITPTKDTVVLPLLKEKGIDYLALGHVHSYACNPLDDRGVYCYSVCLEGRGYDETGEKGYVSIEIENRSLQSAFHPFAERTIHEITINVTGLEENYDIEQHIEEKLSGIGQKDLIRLVLEGELGSRARVFPEDLEEKLNKRFFHCRVKDRTVLSIDDSDIENELSLKGEFVRKVLASSLPDADKKRIIRQGLRALDGEEVEEY
jgi:DNA repair exonuclease SbcCD nuclease subunit